MLRDDRISYLALRRGGLSFRRGATALVQNDQLALGRAKTRSASDGLVIRGDGNVRSALHVAAMLRCLDACDVDSLHPQTRSPYRLAESARSL